MSPDNRILLLVDRAKLQISLRDMKDDKISAANSWHENKHGTILLKLVTGVIYT